MPPLASVAVRQYLRLQEIHERRFLDALRTFFDAQSKMIRSRVDPLLPGLIAGAGAITLDEVVGPAVLDSDGDTMTAALAIPALFLLSEVYDYTTRSYGLTVPASTRASKTGVTAEVLDQLDEVLSAERAAGVAGELVLPANMKFIDFPAPGGGVRRLRYDPRSKMFNRLLGQMAGRISSAGGMTDVTRRRIRRALIRGLRDGDTFEQLTTRIDTHVRDINRSRTIARTEVTQTLGRLNADIWQESGVKYVNIYDGPSCHWYTHTRGPLANGLTVTVEQYQSRTLAHPNCVRMATPTLGIETPDKGL